MAQISCKGLSKYTLPEAILLHQRKKIKLAKVEEQGRKLDFIFLG